MRSFNDSKGREWHLDITIDACRRVKKADLGVDLLNIEAGKPPVMTRIATDVELLCNVCWAIVAPQAAQMEQPVDGYAFGQALGGAAIFAMQNAFWGAVGDFFRSLGKT